MSLSKGQIAECWYYGYKIKSELDDLVYIIQSANNELCSLENIITKEIIECTNKEVENNFSRADNAKYGASIEEIEKELGL